MTGLVESARNVVDLALEVYRADGGEDSNRAASMLVDARTRLDEPLRVALAGTLTSGKSTLLNALVGERIAATDAGECTRLVTWYEDAVACSVAREGHDGARREVPFSLDGQGLEIDLAAAGDPEDTARLVVGWPSAGLAETTLIDTPGLDSAEEGTSARTLSFVTPDDRPSGADVVVYLMRQAHPSDVRFLEAFTDLADGGAGGLGGVGATGTIVVLSRADEIGAGRIDALDTAAQVAASYADHPLLRPLCQTVVAVDGLLAETGRTLRQAEVTALRSLARAPREEVDLMLLSVDRFTAPELPAPVAEALGDEADRLDAECRRLLMNRLGIYGLRVATTALRDGAPDGGDLDSPALAEELVARSGLDALRDVLRSRVTERADVYKARSALLAVERVLAAADREAATPVHLELERALARAHEFTEQRICTSLRAGEIRMPDELAEEAVRVLGGRGPSPARRLGLDPSEPDVEPVEADPLHGDLGDLGDLGDVDGIGDLDDAGIGIEPAGDLVVGTPDATPDAVDAVDAEPVDAPVDDAPVDDAPETAAATVADGPRHRRARTVPEVSADDLEQLRREEEARRPGPGAIREAAMSTLERWRIRAESPLTSRAVAEVSRAVVRSVEEILAAVPEEGRDAPSVDGTRDGDAAARPPWARWSRRRTKADASP